MSAKSDLFTRLQYLNAAVNLPTLIDNGINITEHNGVANLLRKGLGIVAFNILEDFIKDKSLESLNTLSNSGLAFDNLTSFLQDSAIIGALNALAFRSNMLKKESSDWRTLIQEETLKIHSTSREMYEISKYSLVYAGSNISANEIADLLKAFGMSGGWGLMKEVSDGIGGGLPDLAQAYKNAASRRHNAAHTASFQYDYVWIANIKNEILTIAAALDILLTARCRQVNSNLIKKIEEHDIRSALNYRFLEPKNTTYRETTSIGGRSKKNWPSLQNAITTIKPNLVTRNEFLIILDSSRRIEDWFV
ncbi:hypothetical protein DXT99_01770 [Pontibacter diazotrophicus]|uniref:RiboL-PSP-HEPN domain-containing protein n=1 Tax=Pontibacter diazotrophicus TaxID=1400979 RepID=A0A3D8LHQ4_9BACT|nr:HEPN domain-containing protein [Pontibacter diazotrophicus]RDV16866.1 hypothetical protein DXT99_01770 [Pontibacter diazotrophicus]